MKPSQPPKSHELLDRYVDGLLDEAGRGAFERHLEQDALLRAELQRQSRVDQALRDKCSPTATSHDVLARIVQAAALQVEARPKAGIRRFSKPLAIAAILVLGAVGIFRIWAFFGPPASTRYQPRERKPMHVHYRDFIEHGFKPDWLCKDDDEFASTFKKQLGQPLLLAKAPDGVRAAGLAYANTLTPRTLVLLGYAGDQPILVFADRARFDVPPSIPIETGLKLFRRELGKLVLYELSPLAQPYLLGLFYEPRG